VANNLTRGHPQQNKALISIMHSKFSKTLHTHLFDFKGDAICKVIKMKHSAEKTD
jgi:hypothetical protein